MAKDKTKKRESVAEPAAVTEHSDNPPVVEEENTSPENPVIAIDANDNPPSEQPDQPEPTAEPESAPQPAPEPVTDTVAEDDPEPAPVVVAKRGAQIASSQSFTASVTHDDKNHTKVVVSANLSASIMEVAISAVGFQWRRTYNPAVKLCQITFATPEGGIIVRVRPSSRKWEQINL